VLINSFTSPVRKRKKETGRREWGAYASKVIKKEERKNGLSNFPAGRGRNKDNPILSISEKEKLGLRTRDEYSFVQHVSWEKKKGREKVTVA